MYLYFSCLQQFVSFITGASYIKIMLMENNQLQHLDISHNNINDDGMRQITEALQYNNTLAELVTRRCHFSVEGR